MQCNLQLHNNNDKTKGCNIFLKKIFFVIHYLLVLYLKGSN